MSAPDWTAVRRVLAVRLDNIGDVVMVGPALRTLRAALPGARIDLLCSPGGAQAAPLLPWVDETWTHRALWQDVSPDPPLDPAAELALVERLRAGRYDVAAIFTSFSQSPHPPAYACYLAGIPARLGQTREFGGGVLSHADPGPPDEAHQVDRSLALLESAGLEAAAAHLEVAVPSEAAAGAERALAAAGIAPGQPFIVVAPGASARARIYSPERFGEAAGRVAGESGLPLVLVGGPREAELAGRVQDAIAGRVVSLVGRTSVPELAGVIERARLLISANSSPPHLADAVGTPVLVLFAGTELESQWRPRSTPARLLRRETWCSPCHRFACPYEHECLDIAPGEVAAEALALLAATEPAAASAR